MSALFFSINFLQTFRKCLSEQNQSVGLLSKHQFQEREVVHFRNSCQKGVSASTLGQVNIGKKFTIPKNKVDEQALK